MYTYQHKCLSTLWILTFFIAGSLTTNLYGDNWGVTRINTKKFSYLWTITNYSCNYLELDKILESPIFSGDGRTQWQLRWKPKADKDYAGLVLSYKSEINVTVYCEFFIIDGNGKKTNFHSYTYTFFDNRGLGWPQFIKQSILQDKAMNLLPNDALSIFVEMTVTAGTTNISGHCKFSHNTLVSNQTAMLFKNRFLSDVRVVVNGHAITLAHRAVLATHGSWFYEQFVKDPKSDKVNIDNTTESAVWQALRFMYTGKIEDVESTASELLALSNRLGIAQLKLFAEEALCKSMKPVNATEILMLARLHGAENLEREALNYIAAHATSVVDSSGFQELESSKPNPFYDVLRILIDKRKH